MSLSFTYHLDIHFIRPKGVLDRQITYIIKADCKDTRNVVPIPAMKAYTGCTSLTPLILNLGTRCGGVVNIRYRLPYPRKKPRYPLNRRLRGPRSQPGRFGEEYSFFTLPGLEPRAAQPAAQSLYQLSYLGSCNDPTLFLLYFINIRCCWRPRFEKIQ
jgi:hypothetical protein